MEVSPQDDRQHRTLTLDNGLQALVTSDPSAEKGSAAVSVDVGAQADPPCLPGLAHFTEHMCFLGSEKYPQENAYKVYLNSHAGRANASTSADCTCFEFDVAAEHLEGALEIFSGFFVAPLFTASATDRELNAVDAEDSKNRTNDGRRMLQVWKAIAEPEHPWAKFSTGNLKTLRDDVPAGLDVRGVVLQFHGLHYIAPRMRLVICGRDPLDQLEQWARTYFCDVPSEPRDAGQGERIAEAVAAGANQACPPAGVPPLGVPFNTPFAGKAPLLLEVAPLRELRELTLSWSMPASRSFYRADAAHVVSHLLGHEGEGSVFAIAQDKGWATTLSAGTGTCTSHFSTFQVKVGLTPEGESHWEELVSLILHYCKLLRELTEEELRCHWDEMRAISALGFRFAQKPQPYTFATSTARSFLRYPAQHLLSHGRVLDDLDPVQVKFVLDQMVIDNLIVRLVNHKFKGATFEHKDMWYEVPYNRRPLDPAVADAASEADRASLHMPEKNEFLPDDLTLFGVTEPRPESVVNPPVKLLEDDRGRLWHKLDERYAQPRVEIQLLLWASLTPFDMIRAGILSSYLSSRLKQSTYAAKCAGMHWNMHPGLGFFLGVGGYSQRCPQLLTKVLEVLLDGPWTGEDLGQQQMRFETMRERAERGVRSLDLARPDTHAVYWTSLLSRPGSLPRAESLEILCAMTLEDLKSHHARWMKRLGAELFVCGNATADHSKAIYESCLATLAARGIEPLPLSELVELDQVSFNPGSYIRLQAPVPNEKEENSAVYVHFQAGVLDMKEKAALRMIHQIMKEPCFNELRTQQQIGYIVSAGLEQGTTLGNTVEALGITIVSKKFACHDVLSRIDAFLVSFRDILTGTTPEVWASHVEALRTRLLMKPKTLGEETSRLLNQIAQRTYRWNLRAQIAEALEALSLEDAVAYYDRLTGPDTRRRVSSLIFGHAHPMPAASEDSAPEGDGSAAAHPVPRICFPPSTDFDALRSSLPVFPSGFATPWAQQAAEPAEPEH